MDKPNLQSVPQQEKFRPADMTDDDIEFVAEQRKQAFIFELKQVRAMALREREKAKAAG